MKCRIEEHTFTLHFVIVRYWCGVKFYVICSMSYSELYLTFYRVLQNFVQTLKQSVTSRIVQRKMWEHNVYTSAKCKNNELSNKKKQEM